MLSDRIITNLVLAIFFVSTFVLSPTIFSAYAQIDGTNIDIIAVRVKKKINKKTGKKKKKINAIGCDTTDNTLHKYKAKGRKASSIVLLKDQKTVTAAEAKAFLKTNSSNATLDPLFAKVTPQISFVTDSKGKIAKPKKDGSNHSAINAEIDACGGGDSLFSQTIESAGMWMDNVFMTSGAIDATITVQELSTATILPAITSSTNFSIMIKINSVGGMPLGCVTAGSLPAETFTITASEDDSPISFDVNSDFVDGNIAGSVAIDSSNNSYTATGTITHHPDACSLVNTTATFTATGALTGANAGNADVDINFPSIGIGETTEVNMAPETT